MRLLGRYADSDLKDLVASPAKFSFLSLGLSVSLKQTAMQNPLGKATAALLMDIFALCGMLSLTDPVR
jgi:hypothetical protein